ncbi:MAG: RNA pseudouridine synthase, partial [Gammaproteobacteria bacterium]
EKYYLAICMGEPSPSNGCIDLPLCPGRKSRFRVAGQRDSIFLNQKLDTATWMLPPSVDSVTPDRKFYPSQTLFHTIFSDGQYSLLMLKPITGRTHQIRVHLAWIGHQLLGDTLYGRPSSSIQQADRLALHSFRLQLTENWLAGVAPQKRVFQAPIPDFFTDFMCGRVQQRADAALDLQSTLDLQSALDMALSSLERAQG